MIEQIKQSLNSLFSIGSAGAQKNEPLLLLGRRTMYRTAILKFLSALTLGIMVLGAGSASATEIQQNVVPIGAQKSANGLDELKSRGAKIQSAATIRKMINKGGGSQKGGVACVGASQCLTLIENFGSQCKSFVCGNDHGTPVCWCDT
jgi:hypothetical protein